MPTPEEPIFSSQPISDSKPKRPIRKRAPARKAAYGGTEAESKKLSASLSDIYQDDRGHLPNMKHIDVKKRGGIGSFFFGIILIGALLCGAAWVGFFVLPGNKNLSADNLTFTIDGPNLTTLDATTTYTLTINNSQNIALKNSVVTVRYPASFIYLGSSQPAANTSHSEWDLNDVAANKKVTLSITGKILGNPEEDQSWRVFLNYRPENLQSDLQKTAILETKIKKSPITVAIAGPDTATVGTDVTYHFSLKNDSDWQPQQFEVAPILPANFHLSSSTPALVKNRWVVNMASASGTIALADLNFAITGQYADSEEAASSMGAELRMPLSEPGKTATIAKNSLLTTVAKNDLGLSMAINGVTKDFSAAPGDTLSATLNIKNLSAQNLSKAQLVMTLDAPALDKQSILNWKEVVDKYDGDIQGKQLSDTVRQGQITWDSKLIPALKQIKPKDEINVDIRLPIKSGAQINLANLAENKIAVRAELNYTDSNGAVQTISASPINISLSSDLKLEVRHSVSGAKHDISWVLTNSFHSLKDLKLSADTFGDITVSTPATPPAGTVVYDSKTKSMVWTIPEMPDSMDVLALPFTVTVNKANPTQNTLVSKVHVTATDAVTGESLDFMGDEVTTNL